MQQGRFPDRICAWIPPWLTGSSNWLWCAGISPPRRWSRRAPTPPPGKPGPTRRSPPGWPVGSATGSSDNSAAAVWAEVYLAEDPRVGRKVAIKFLHRDDLETVERFLQEARIQARIQHGHVGRIYEVGDLDGRPFIAMQFTDGRPLGALRDELGWRDKVRIIARAADALHAAHKDTTTDANRPRRLAPVTRRSPTHTGTNRLPVFGSWLSLTLSRRIVTGS